MQKFGLNQPLYVQYYLYLKGIFATFPPDLGVSTQYYPQSVASLIVTRAGWTLLLIVASLFLAFVISYALGALSSIKRGSKAEMISTYLTIFIHATPVYWSALVLLFIFAATLHWFPIFGKVSVNATGGFAYFTSVLWHAVLPVIAMTLSIFGENYLVLRGTVQDVMKSDYVTAASLRGLRARMVATKYVLRNSLLPLVSILAFSLAGLVSRAILVEAVFGYAGLGDLVVDAALNFDYPVLEGSLFVLTLMIIAGGLIGDLILLRLDPKLRR